MCKWKHQEEREGEENNKIDILKRHLEKDQMKIIKTFRKKPEPVNLKKLCQK